MFKDKRHARPGIEHLNFNHEHPKGKKEKRQRARENLPPWAETHDNHSRRDSRLSVLDEPSFICRRLKLLDSAKDRPTVTEEISKETTKKGRVGRWWTVLNNALIGLAG